MFIDAFVWMSPLKQSLHKAVEELGVIIILRIGL